MKLLVALLVLAPFVWGMTACGTGSDTVSSSHTSSAAGVDTGASAASAKAALVHPQNDDYISTYGHEAREPEKRRISDLVKRYYTAALAGEGAVACSFVYSTLAKSVAEDYGTAGSPHSTNCAAVLPKLFRHAPGLSAADLASTTVTGVRLRGNRGFVQLSSKAMRTGEISIEREGRTWKLGALLGRACANCSTH